MAMWGTPATDIRTVMRTNITDAPMRIIFDHERLLCPSRFRYAKSSASFIVAVVSKNAY